MTYIARYMRYGVDQEEEFPTFVMAHRYLASGEEQGVCVAVAIARQDDGAETVISEGDTLRASLWDHDPPAEFVAEQEAYDAEQERQMQELIRQHAGRLVLDPSRVTHLIETKDGWIIHMRAGEKEGA